MFRDIKITLYDIFGFLIPGSIFLVSLAILFWTFCYPHYPLKFNKISLEIWAMILILAYISGHLGQAIANFLEYILRSHEKIIISKKLDDKLPEEFKNKAISKIKNTLNINIKEVTDEDIYKYCDAIIAQKGNTADREIYQYRVGFYRGMTISFIFLFISLILRKAIPTAMVNTFIGKESIDWKIFLFLIIMSLFGFLLTHYRYKRFARYRIVNSIMGFLAL